MHGSMTFGQWLEPDQDAMDEAAWRGLGRVSETALLHAAVDCARQGDVGSLCALMRQLRTDGAPPMLVENRARDLTLDEPDFTDLSDLLGDASVQDKRDERMPMRQTVARNCSIEFAVALCLSRQRVHGHVQMPLSNRLDVPTEFAAPRKEALDAREQALLGLAIEFYASLDGKRRARRDPAKRAAAAEGRLFFECAALVPCADVVGVFQAKGIDPSELSVGMLDDRRHANSTRVTALGRAVRWGNVEMALAIARLPQLADHAADRDFVANALLHTQAGTNGQEAHGFSEMLLHETQRATKPGEVGSRAQARLQDIVELLNIAMASMDDGRLMDFRMSLLEKYLGECNRRTTPWKEETIHLLLGPLAADHERQVRQWCDDDHNGLKYLARLAKFHCAPVLEWMAPALPDALKQWCRSEWSWKNKGAPGEEMAPLPANERVALGAALVQLSSPAELTRHLPIGQFQRTLAVLHAAGLDLKAPVEVHSTISGPGHGTLLHLLAEKNARNTVAQMLATLEFGLDPQAKDSLGRVPGQLLNDARALEDWDAAWRSHQAREACLQAVQELDSRLPGARI